MSRSPRELDPETKRRLGRLIWAFLRAGWNPPRPSDRATHALLEDMERVLPHATLELARRERQTLELMANGLTRNEIARELGISPETVKTTQTKILRRLGAENAANAVAIGFRLGILR